MQSKFIALVALTAMLSCVVEIFAQKQSGLSDIRLEDPMFGIAYMPSRVRYEDLPERVMKVCPGLHKGKYWIFAHYQQANNEYYITMGVIPAQTGDSLGIALWIKGSQCQADDSTGMLSGRPPKGEYTETKKSDQLPGHDAPNICPEGASGNCFYYFRSKEEESIVRGLILDSIQRAKNAYKIEGGFVKKACSEKTISASLTAPLVEEELNKLCSHEK